MPENNWLDEAVKATKSNDNDWLGEAVKATKSNDNDWLGEAVKVSTESKKKSQSQSGSSTEESSSATSETKKEQSSGTTKPVSLEDKKALARKQKLEQMGWKADEETEKSFKGELTKDEKKSQALQKAKSVGETFAPNIEQKARERETQQGIKAERVEQAKPEVISERKLRGIPQEDLKALFEGDSELTMFDGGQRIAEKYSLTDEELEKAKQKYLTDKVSEFKKKDLQDSYDLLSKYSPAPETFKEASGFVKQQELLQKAKDMSFDKHEKLSISLMDLDDTQKKTVKEFTDVMDRLNAYREKTFMQKQQGANAQGKGSVVITPKEDAQFAKDAQEFQRLSKEVDKIRGNNNRLFDETAEVISKQTGKKPLTQESFTKKYENDYTKLKSALVDASYKLNYLEKEARSIRDTSREKGRVLTAKQNEALSNLDRERNLAKAEVLALSNALFLNEDVTKKVNRYKEDSYGHEKVFGVVKDLYQGFSSNVLQEFNMTSETELSQARIVNEKLKEIGIDLGVDEKLKPTFKEQIGGVAGTSAVLGANIAATSFLTGGVGTLARGAGMLPKVFAMYDKGGKFKKIADVVISGVNFELASDETSFAMGSAEEAAQLVFNKVTGKLKPLNPIVNFFTKSLVGATGVAFEEYAGDLFHEFTKNGFNQEAIDNTFGKSKEEGLEKLALTFTMGMMSMGKHAKVLMVGSLKEAKAINPEAETTQAMEAVLSEMGIDPDDFIEELKKQVETKSNRAYPDGNGGVLLASNMTEEQEIALREKLGIRPLTEEELTLKRSVQQTPDLDADSPYTTKEEMEADLRLLKGEDEGTLPNTYVGESVLTDEGVVTTVTEKVEEGTQLRVPTEQLVTEEAKAVDDKFDREKAGVIDVWQDPETNELVVVNGTKRVATAFEDGVASVDVRVIKANSLEEAKQVGELINKLQDTEKKQEAVDLVKANPNLKETLDLNNPKELELYGLASLNKSLSEELKSNPKQAGVLAVIGNNVSTEKQSEVYQFAKDNKLSVEEVAQLVKETKVIDQIKTTTESLEKADDNLLSKIKEKLNNVFYTGRGKKFDDLTKTKGDFIFFSGNKKKSSWYGGDESNVTEAFIDDSEYLDLTSQSKKSKFVEENFSDEDILKLYKEEIKFQLERDVFGKKTKEELINQYRESAKENSFSGDNKEQKFLLEKAKELGFKGIKLLDTFFGESDISTIAIDKSTIKTLNPKSISEAYSKAKKDGSNPALVEAVESVLSENSQLKAEVELKTKMSQTGQSNIDALKKDATQLGVEPNNLYESILKLSPTAQGLIEKYSKAIADGLYSSTEAVLRLNSEIKENFDAIVKEIDMPNVKKEAAQLESAFTSERKTLAEKLIDISNKINIQADKIGKNTYSIIIPGGPSVAEYFLKALSVALKTSATFAEGLQKAIKSLKRSKLLKGKTAKEVNDIITQLTKVAAELQRKAELKNPTTKKQQDLIKQSVEAKIKHLNANFLTTVPSIEAIEKLAKREGIIDAKEFAEKLFKNIKDSEESKIKRMNKFKRDLSKFFGNEKLNVDALFNQLSDLILKDKQQAVILRNIFLDAMASPLFTRKGIPFSAAQVASITAAFQKAKLNNLSGIYDLTKQIEQIVDKASEYKANEDIKSLQKSIAKFKNIPKKQLMIFQQLVNVNPNHITTPINKIDLINVLEDIKSYLSGKSNLSSTESSLTNLINILDTEAQNYLTEKEDALIKKRYKDYKKNNPSTTLSESEYKEMILMPEIERDNARKKGDREIKRDPKRADLEKLTEDNINELIDYEIEKLTNKDILEIGTFNNILIPSLKKILETGGLSKLSDIQLKEINQLHAELLNFNSSSKLGFVANQMSGVLKANENKQLIQDSFREFGNVAKRMLEPWKGKYQGLTLGQAFKRIFVGSTGQKISSEIMGRVNVGINYAKTEYKKFNKAFEEALKFEISASENYDLGAKAYFLTSPKGLDPIDAQLLFENKKNKLERDIEELIRISKSDSSSSKKKSAESRAKQYQESLDFVNQYDSYEDYVNAYNNGEVLSEKQQKIFDLARNEYEKQKPKLIASNTLFNGKAFIEEDFYTSTSYLKNEIGQKESKSVADAEYNNLNVIRDTQSGTVFKKVNPAAVGTDRILDFDFSGVTQSRVLENYYDMFTRGAVIELDALLQADSFYENFKDKNMTETYSYLYKRIANWINNETSVQQSKLDNSLSVEKRVSNVLSNIKKSILNTTGQVIKQPTVLFHTLSRFGFTDFKQGLFFYANNLATEEGREKIRQLLDGSDVRNRAPLGDEQIAQSLNRQKTFALTDNETYRFLQKLYSEPLKMVPGIKNIKGISKLSLEGVLNIGDIAMVYSDIMAAQLTYITAMINQQKKEGYDVKSIDDLISNKNEKNTHIADMLSAEINNESATSKQGNLFSGKDNKVLANLFFMFQSHAANASNAASNALLDLFERNKNVTVEDRFNGVKAIVGFTSAIVTFRAMSEIVKLLYAQIYETAAEEIGYEDPRDDEEKERLKLLKDKKFLEEASVRIGLNSFTDVFFGGKFPSPVKDIATFGANTLFENLHLKYVDEEYEGRLPYSSNPMEYSGVVGAGLEFVSDAYKIISPPLEKVEKDDILRDMAVKTLLKQQWQSYKNDKQGAFIDGLYTMFKLSGKGEPAKMMQMLQKQRERGLKEDDKERAGIINLYFEQRK